MGPKGCDGRSGLSEKACKRSIKIFPEKVSKARKLRGGENQWITTQQFSSRFKIAVG